MLFFLRVYWQNPSWGGAWLCWDVFCVYKLGWTNLSTFCQRIKMQSITSLFHIILPISLMVWKILSNTSHVATVKPKFEVWKMTNKRNVSSSSSSCPPSPTTIPSWLCQTSFPSISLIINLLLDRSLSEVFVLFFCFTYLYQVFIYE